MITVVSLNPSIDKTIGIDSLQVGGTNRIDSVRTDIGGKGVNVCLHLRALGARDVCCTGIMYEADDSVFRSALEASGVRCDWLSLPGNVRVNTKVREKDGTVTELNERGQTFSEALLPTLLEKLEPLFLRSKVVVLAGSVPPGMPAGIYRTLIDSAKSSGAACVLDASGEALKAGIMACPTVAKPNRDEFRLLTGLDLSTVNEVIHCGNALRGKLAEHICLSLGADGALLFTPEGAFKAEAIPVDVQSTVGAGDAMTAALALSLERDELSSDPQKCLERAVSAAAAAIAAPGTQALDQRNYLNCLDLAKAKRIR